jgi:hypothetical protein
MSQKETNQRKSSKEDISQSGKNNYINENGDTNEKKKCKKNKNG